MLPMTGVPVPSPFLGVDEEGIQRNVVDALLRIARDLENLVVMLERKENA